MSKKNSNSLTVPDSYKEAGICIKNGIKVYPVQIRSKWKIEVDNNGKITVIDKEISQNEINYAMAMTYIFYAGKIEKLKK